MAVGVVAGVVSPRRWGAHSAAAVYRGKSRRTR